MAQSQTSRTFQNEAAVSRISTILSLDSFDGRRTLGRSICKGFSYAGPSGRLRLAGCLESYARRPQHFPPAITEHRSEAFWDWNEVLGTLHSDTFLTGLLAHRHMQG